MKFIGDFILGFLVGIFIVNVLSFIANADETNFKYGLGIVGKPTSEIKTFSLGKEGDFVGPIKQQQQLGFWSDVHEGRKSSAFGTYQLGIRPEVDHFYMEAFFGPALISTPDYNTLSGNFQFEHDLGLGFLGKDRSGIGIGYRHISNAGIMLPNRGRDFLLIKLEIGL